MAARLKAGGASPADLNYRPIINRKRRERYAVDPAYRAKHLRRLAAWRRANPDRHRASWEKGNAKRSSQTQ